jgi:putative CocE/NonD family hydrolase
MKILQRLLLIILAIFVSGVILSQDITGDWYGAIQVENLSLRLDIHIQKDNDQLKATLDSPDQGAFDIPIDNISLTENIISYSIEALGFEYDGQVDADFTTIKGTMYQAGQSFQLNFSREPVKPSKSSLEYLKTIYDKQEVYIPMRDGVRLFTSIYTPKDKSEKHPMMMMRTPYNSEPRGEEHYNFFLSLFSRYTDENYIMVFQDVRGRYMSEGEFMDVRPYNPDKKKKETDDNSDTYDAIDWLVNNVENNNGRVGIQGVSYPGFYATMSLMEAHPALKAVSPQAPVADWFIGDDFHHNGAFFLMDCFNFFYGFGREFEQPTRQGFPGVEYPSQDNFQFFLELGTVKNITEEYYSDIKFWNQAMDHPNYDDFWKARTPLPHLKDIKPAVLTVGGWFDAEDLYGPLYTYRAIEKKNPENDANRIMMGPWAHGQWAFGNGDNLGNIHWGSNTSEYGREVILNFFNYYLKDKDQMDLPEATIFNTGSNEWKAFETWPPENVEEVSLYLQEAGGLEFSAPTATDNFVEYVTDPMKPVPYTEDVHLRRTTTYMTDDQRFASRRPDVMVFRTDPLQEDITFTGPVIADLFVSTTGTDADFVVKLIDVFPDDLSDYPENDNNVPMQGYQMLVRGEVMRGRFRNSFEKPEPFVPGEITRVSFTIPDIAHTFRKGHRIMIQVQHSWFPLVDRNPQKFVDIYTCDESDFQKATHRIYFDRDHPSQVMLHKLSK